MGLNSFKNSVNELIRLYQLATGGLTAPLTASRGVVSNSAGALASSVATATEVGYTSGVTSALQTQINTKLTATSTTPASLDIIQYSGSAYVNRTIEAAEVNTTPVAGANDTVSGTNVRHYTCFTLPTNATYYRITGIEWLMGSVAANTMTCGIEATDAIPPPLAQMRILAWGTPVAATGTSVIQRQSSISSIFIPGGTICAAYVANSGATSRIGTTTVSSNNNQKSVAGSGLFGDQTAWTATTEEPYIKVYYRPVFGV